MQRRTDTAQKTTTRQVRDALGDEERFRFQCTACGNCCRGPGSVFFTPADLERIYAHLGLSDNEPERRKLRARLVQGSANGLLYHHTPEACALLDESGRCSVYPVRPLQCRTFPFWPSIFASPEALDETRSDCPGMRRKDSESYGPFHTALRVNRTRDRFSALQDADENPITL